MQRLSWLIYLYRLRLHTCSLILIYSHYLFMDSPYLARVAFTSNLDTPSECLGECLCCSPLSFALVMLIISTLVPSHQQGSVPPINTGKEVSVHVTF